MAESNDNLFDNYGQDGSDLLGNNGNDQLLSHQGGADASLGETMTEDADFQDIKQRVKGMDEEAARLIQLQTEMEQQMKTTSSPSTSK